MASYTYNVLPERTIRLLTVFAGKFEDEVAVSLSNSSIDNPPEYEAVSYTWGDANETRPIRYGAGATMHVTVSLHAALKHLRQAGCPRILWIDALCVNQSDPYEKSTQIPLMAEVYSSAKQVLLWLGSESDNDRLAFRSMRMATLYLETRPPPPGDAIADDQRRQGDRNVPFPTWVLDDYLRSEGSPYKIHWAQILALFRRPYFQRLWVVQEIVKAQQAVAICGHETIPWRFIHKIATCPVEVGTLSVVTEDMVSQIRDMTMVDCQYDTIHFGIPNVRTIASIGQDPYRKLATLLNYTMTFQCSDPRDHIFALLGLASDLDGYDDIKPDYTVDARDIFRRVALAVIRKECDLRILPSVSRVTPPSPTWVPQFDREEIWFSHDKVSRYFRASGDMHLQIRTSDDERVIHLYGKRMDEIESLGPTLMSIPLPEPADCMSHLVEALGDAAPYVKRIYNWLRASREFAGADIYQPETERFEAFGETITYGTMDSTITFSRYMKILEDMVDGPSLAELELNDTTRINYETSVIESARDGCFCITKTGRLCLVPGTSQVGDSIWVVFG